MGLLLIRILGFEGLHWGPPIYGNDEVHLGLRENQAQKLYDKVCYCLGSNFILI